VWYTFLIHAWMHDHPGNTHNGVVELFSEMEYAEVQVRSFEYYMLDHVSIIKKLLYKVFSSSVI
jgi:hypothetical protein